MSRTVSFSFDTEQQKRAFENYARAKGMKLSALAKMSLHQYAAKYPIKASKTRGIVVYPDDIPTGAETVQPVSVDENYIEDELRGTV